MDITDSITENVDACPIEEFTYTNLFMSKKGMCRPKSNNLGMDLL
jgi:hypothetical protein